MGQTQIGLRFPAQQCLPLMADQQEKRRQTAVRLGNQKQPQSIQFEIMTIFTACVVGERPPVPKVPPGVRSALTKYTVQ